LKVINRPVDGVSSEADRGALALAGPGDGVDASRVDRRGSVARAGERATHPIARDLGAAGVVGRSPRLLPLGVNVQGERIGG
jgi:hypothetical protein